MTIKAAIFDMDGTILDTIEDLAAALNHTLAHFGYRREFTPEEAKRFFCNGARAAIAGALSEVNPKAEGSHIDEVLSYYKPWYADHSDIRTGPYPGILTLLKDLGSAGIRTAVISNKPDPAVQKLCSIYFPEQFDFALGEKAGIPRKPAPDMIRICLENLETCPKQAVYIGDSEVDIQTALNSSLCSICVDWGFRSREELSGADRIVSSCDDLKQAILTL